MKSVLELVSFQAMKPLSVIKPTATQDRVLKRTLPIVSRYPDGTVGALYRDKQLFLYAWREEKEISTSRPS